MKSPKERIWTRLRCCVQSALQGLGLSRQSDRPASCIGSMVHRSHRATDCTEVGSGPTVSNTDWCTQFMSSCCNLIEHATNLLLKRGTKRKFGLIFVTGAWELLIVTSNRGALRNRPVTATQLLESDCHRTDNLLHTLQFDLWSRERLNLLASKLVKIGFTSRFHLNGANSDGGAVQHCS